MKYKYIAFLIFIAASLFVNKDISAQSITFDNVPPLSGGGSTAGGVCFNFATNQAIVVENLRCAFSTASGTANIWYNPNKINGQPTINVANGWVNLGTATFAGQSPASANPVVQTIPIPLTLNMMPGDTFGFAIQWTGNVYPTTNVNTPTFTNGIVTIIADASCAFTFSSAMTSFFTPRQINGGVIYSIAGVDNDAGVDSLLSPEGLFCSGNQDLIIRASNLGTNIVNNMEVHWTLDGVSQTPITYNTPLPTMASPNNFVDLNLGSYNFPYGQNTVVKAWTYMPNSVADADNSNDTLTIAINPPIQGVIVDINPQDTIVCTGAILTLDAGLQPSGAIYVWNTGALTRTIDVDESGSYIIKVQSLGGCIDEDTVNVTFAPPPAAQAILVTPTGSNSFNFNLYAEQHVDEYNWNFGDGTPEETGAGQKSHTYTVAGNYTVTCTLSNSCGESVVSRPVSATLTSIDDLEVLSNSIKVYPNPAKDKIIVAANVGVQINKISVFNVVGQKIDGSIFENETKIQLNTAAYAQGTYQIVIETNKGRLVKKVQVAK